MEYHEVAILEKLQWLIDDQFKYLNSNAKKISLETEINTDLAGGNGFEPFTISMIIPEIEDLFGVMITDVFIHFDKMSDLVTFLIFEKIEKVLQQKKLRYKEADIERKYFYQSKSNDH